MGAGFRHAGRAGLSSWGGSPEEQASPDKGAGASYAAKVKGSGAANLFAATPKRQPAPTGLEAQLAAIPTESNGETLNDTQRMIMAYEANHGSISGLVMELDSIILEIDKSSPKIGTWIGTFDSTEIPGPYTFVIRADGCSDLCEPFSREITRTINIFEEIEPMLSNIDIEMPSDNTIVVTVTPTTKALNDSAQTPNSDR